jgi:hypothetical protein
VPGRDLFEGWREAGVDPGKPSSARVYDYWLGGEHNFVADREVGDAMARLDPWIPAACRANRAFLGRAVRYVASQGVAQFLDIGSGIPTAGNVHEAAPGARVVYVDRDPVAVAEGRKLLDHTERAVVLQADLRDPAAILASPLTRSMIDFTEPVAIMLMAILHFVLDAGDPDRIVSALRDAAAPGSFLVISHITGDANQALATAVSRLYNDKAADGQARSREEVARFFGDWKLAGPGLVYAPRWRPDPAGDEPASAERMWFLAGVARKPDPSCA